MAMIPARVQAGFGEMMLSAASSASLLLTPLLALQGMSVRRSTPRLPGAAGPSCGRFPVLAAELRLLVVGESTVAGVGAPDHASALTGQIAAKLFARTSRAVRWQAFGKIGATAHCARVELVPLVPAEPVDVLVVALGANDTLKLHTPRRWTRDLGCLIEDLRGRVGPAPVVLAPIPPLGEFPGLPQPLKSVLGLRAGALELAAKKLAPTIERVVYCATRPQRSIAELFCSDRFHPSTEGYELCGEMIASAIEPLI